MEGLEVAPAADTALEQELITRVDRWLQHMTWRPDFARWRHDRLWQERNQDDRLATVERYGASLEGRRVLEIGSGMGGTSVAMALRGAHPVATDFNRDYCGIARLRAARYDLALPTFNAAGEAIPFAAETFALALCWDVVEHVQDPDGLLAELSRVIRPNGRVLLTVINRYAWRDPHYHLVAINYLPRPIAEWLIRQRGRSKAGSSLQDKQRLGEMHYFTYRQFEHLARRHGFRLYDIREDRVRRREGTASGLKGRLRDFFYRTGLAVPVYRIYRAVALGTYELLLVRSEQARNGGHAAREAGQ